jgi:fatty-acyl-CoA synthase
MLRNVFVLGAEGSPRAAAQTVAQLEQLGTPEDLQEVVQRERDGDAEAICDILYTSGTTGRPKGVVLKHDMVLRTAYGSAYWCAYETGRRMLFALPMYHVFGYVECLVAITFVGGAVIPQVKFDPVGTLEAVAKHRANELACVPMMTIKVVEAARARTFDLSSLTTMFNSGGACPPELWTDIRTVLGVQEILTAYGQTETTASTTCVRPEDPHERLLTTNGALKLAGVAGLAEYGGLLARYKVVDPETQEELPAGTAGELLVKGINVTPGYYDKPEETAAAFTPDGWLRTGDIGTVSADGYLKLTGRIKESYRCGGEMVMPREIELVLNEHPGVEESHVVGLADERMGEIGCACIVPRSEVRPDPDELIALCARSLARFKVPRHVVFVSVEELPLTATGRVQKFKLAELAKQRLAQPADVSPTNGDAEHVNSP